MQIQDDPVLYSLIILFILSVVCAVFLFFYGLSWFLSNLMNSPFTEQEEIILKSIVNKDKR